MVSGLRGYVLTNEAFFIETYDSAILENKQILDVLTELVADRADQAATLNEVKKLNEYWISEVALPLFAAKVETSPNDQGKIFFDNLYRKKISDGIEKKIQRSLQQRFVELINYEYQFRDVQKKKLTSTIEQTKSISFSLTAISIIMGICIAMFLAYYISSRIVNMVKMANTIAEGEYNVRMNDSGKSELSQLAHALNNMAKILNTNISILKRQKEELDQFAHIVSHDLKAPLRGIDNVVTWIEEDHSFDLQPKVIEYLELIKGRTRRADNLLRGILLYAKIGREQRDKEVVDLNELLAEVIPDIPKKAGIELYIQPNLPVLYTERTPLVQIFTNLIGNAFKYHDRPTGYVKVFYRIVDDHFKFSIQDDGPGIDKKHHQKIFHIFQTLHERDTIESTGVGLAIVKKILDDRNLKIGVDSELRKGSTFSFTWPQNEFNEQSY